MKTCFLLNENLNKDLYIEFTSNWQYKFEYNLILITTEHGYQALTDDQRACFYDIFTISNFDLLTLTELLQQHSRLLDLQSTRIIAYDEEVLMPAAHLREYFNIPGDRPKDIYHFINKIEMKKRLTNSKICLPRYICYDNDEFNRSPKQYLDDIVHKLGLPIFAKPIDKTASVDTKLIATTEELYKWCIKHSCDKNFELDEYITGEFYSCNSIIINNEIQHSEVAQYLNPSFDYLCGKPRGSITLPLDLNIVDEILKYNREVLKLLQPPIHCITHLEVFKKITGELIFIEIAARPPGSGISKLYEKRIGVNLQKIFILMQMGLKPEIFIKPGAYTAVAYFPPQKGTVSEIYPLEFKSTHKIDWKIQVGDYLSCPQTILDETGEIFLSNDNFDDLEQDFLSINEMIPFNLT